MQCAQEQKLQQELFHVGLSMIHPIHPSSAFGSLYPTNFSATHSHMHTWYLWSQGHRHIQANLSASTIWALIRFSYEACSARKRQLCPRFPLTVFFFFFPWHLHHCSLFLFVRCVSFWPEKGGDHKNISFPIATGQPSPSAAQSYVPTKEGQR